MQAYIQDLKRAIGSAAELMQAIGSSVCSMLSMVMELLTCHILVAYPIIFRIISLYFPDFLAHCYLF